MMSKLALKNATKSIKDYGVYFFTLVLGVCIFYMFNSIYAQEEMMSFRYSTHNALKSLTQVLGYVSVFVSIILGFLIIYANNYFIKRRKKELGIYMTLGMDKRQISNILVLETFFMAILALISGLLLGIILSQFMSLITAKLFEADLTRFKFILAPEAIWKCIACFGLIFTVVILFNTLTLSRYKLIDLIHGGRQNEGVKLKTPSMAFGIFLLALLCLGVAYRFIVENGILNLTGKFYCSIGLGTIGTLLFFFSLTGFGILLVQHNKRYYFSELNMFVMRQLNSKVNTNFITMSVVCLVLLLTIGILSTGLSIQNVISSDLKESTPFDVSILLADGYNESDETLTIKEKFLEYDNIETALLTTRYYYKDLSYGALLKTENEFNQHFLEAPINFVTVQDLNNSRAMQGKSQLSLPEGHYAIVANTEFVVDYSDALLESQIAIQLRNKTLLPVDTKYEMTLSNLYDGIMILVNDVDLEGMSVADQILSLNYQETKEADIVKTQNYWEALSQKDLEKGCVIAYYVSKYDVYINSVTSKAIISFLAIYIGLVFLITSAAILALQQLSEAIDNKKRYDMLKKLGADRNMIRKALFKQIALYFMLPLGLAIIHSVVGIYVANRAILTFGEMNIAQNSFITAGAVLVVYGAYFIFTYIGSKNYIEQY